MAPTSVQQSLSAKAKRPVPPGIQTNGIVSSASSPSPSMSASRLPSAVQYPSNSATSNGAASATSGVRSVNRVRREAPGQLLGRGQRNSSVGLRSGSVAADLAISQSSEPQPYIKTDEYILRKYRGNPPSLIIHLLPTHFRFDQQEGSFSYKSPMRLMIEHLKLRTIPHDLAEFFAASNVQYYEGCLIVQVHDSKSTASTKAPTSGTDGSGKAIPFSIHNSNKFLTPSPYVPYKVPNEMLSNEEKDPQQKDKENMPAPPSRPDNLKGKSAEQSKTSKIYTVVLHPTSVSNHADIAIKATDARWNSVDGRDTRQEINVATPLSAVLPPTPSTALPPTPQPNMAPPAKRQKRARTDLDSTNLHAAEAQITLATTAALRLDPCSDAAESAALIQSLAHPMHSSTLPSPKTRKRTVAEMAADEALAAEQEKYMLIFDELRTPGLQGAANPDGDGQVGGASFEPRFERFKTLENIKVQHEENRKADKARQQEAERKAQQDRERERLRQEAEKRENDNKLRQAQAQAQAQAQSANNMRQQQQSQQQDAQRRAMQQAQQGMQGQQPQAQGQHAHPQTNGMVPNGIQTQPQRFQQQQSSQAQAASPVVRNGTPQSHSSPIGNIAMQGSTSSMGGSPPRPGSVVNQNNAQIGGPTSHGMAGQRSQSQTGTPRMPNGTPNLQNTPLQRPMGQTPRMSQASPLQGQMGQGSPMQVMSNGQLINLTPQQAMALQQQRALQQRYMQQQNQAAAMQGMVGMNGQQLTQQQQQQAMAQQLLRQAAQGQQVGNPAQANAQLAQNYQAQLAAMAGGQQNMLSQNVNFNNPNMNMQQMQQMQLRQQQAQLHAQVQAQAQAQAQAHAHAQAQGQVQGQQRPNPSQLANQQQIQFATRGLAQQMFQSQIQQLAPQYGGNIPDEVVQQLKANTTREAQRQMQETVRKRHMQQQLMQQQHALQNNGMNGMNGMGMQRNPGM